MAPKLFRTHGLVAWLKRVSVALLLPAIILSACSDSNPDAARPKGDDRSTSQGVSPTQQGKNDVHFTLAELKNALVATNVPMTTTRITHGKAFICRFADESTATGVEVKPLGNVEGLSVAGDGDRVAKLFSTVVALSTRGDGKHDEIWHVLAPNEQLAASTVDSDGIRYAMTSFGKGYYLSVNLIKPNKPVPEPVQIRHHNNAAVSKRMQAIRANALHGDRDAQYKLGSFCEELFPPDLKQAVRWYEEAASRGQSTAQCSLGVCYLFGYGGLKKSDEMAVKWYKASAGQGDKLGLYNLAEAYKDGYGGLQQDPKMAFNLYRQAAEKGLGAGATEIAIMYQDCVGVNVDDKEAFKWMTKGAELGDPFAQCDVGQAYLDGTLVEQSDDHAVEWLRKAATSGYEDAKTVLKRIGRS